MPGAGWSGRPRSRRTRSAPAACNRTSRADSPSASALARAVLPVPAGRAVVAGPADDPWAALEAWAGRLGTAEVADRLALLDLPAGAIPLDHPPVTPGVRRHVLGEASTRSAPFGWLSERSELKPEDAPPPLVLDLSALWAGPLCADLLHRAGARVIAVESAARPDPSRLGNPVLHRLLRGGVESVRLDFDDPADRHRLRRLIRCADMVIEASRPRAGAARYHPRAGSGRRRGLGQHHRARPRRPPGRLRRRRGGRRRSLGTPQRRRRTRPRGGRPGRPADRAHRRGRGAPPPRGGPGAGRGRHGRRHRRRPARRWGSGHPDRPPGQPSHPRPPPPATRARPGSRAR
ncbi:hypothetical protein CGZ93_05240 [Enemella dayhoffiae]|uniref:CoA transferase n=1 Tax=Enemella dayhoffiae TaxID=2016507 RepID=A0A255H8E1_9ACTN|nr:hypothetical protein CGZ93_05240 [Enemella dayhoffiae]